MTDLEHLDVGHAEVEVRSVAENERTREENSDGKNALDEHGTVHADVLGTIDQASRALQHTRTHGGEEEMPRDDEDGVAEVQLVVQVVVVDDHCRRQCDPHWDDPRRRH
jgi:hypothetical protein